MNPTHFLRRPTAWLLWLLPITGCALGAAPAPASPAKAPSVRFDQGVLTIRTDRYEVAWQSGCLVGLKTLLPRETDLTVAARPMNVEQLPNGLGSLYNAKEAAKQQHHVWTSFDLTVTFPAQHPAHPEASKVSFEPIANGGRLTYAGLKGDPDGTLIQELAVEQGTGDLLIRQEGRSAQPGVFGIGFSLLNLRKEITWATPYFAGQRWDADYGLGKISSTACGSVFWGAPLVVGEMTGGGSLIVWAEDPRLKPKYFRRFNRKDVQGWNFQANDDAPFADRTSTVACTWHFNTYRGNWVEAAQRYKDWMVKAFRMVPRRQRASAWVDDIALAWPTWPDEVAMKQMAETMDPKRVLIMNWGWLAGFNRRVPEYQPPSPEGAVKHAARMHELGFRYGIYTSLGLVDVQAHPTMMKDYDLDFCYNGPTDEKPEKISSEAWLIYVHPGSAKWREFYSDKMAQIHRDYGIDYFYQDVTGCAVGSAGLIEGKTYNEGVIACEEAIRAKVPQAAIGGEYWTQVNAAQEDFGIQSLLIWGGEPHQEVISRPHQPHPLLSFLFSEYCVYWPHQVAVRNTRLFHRDQNINEVIGAIPIWDTAPDDRVSEARVVLERARLLAEGFRPHFPRSWGPNVAAYLRHPQGRVVKYVRPDRSTFCYEETPGGDHLRYARVTGLDHVSFRSPVTIDGWIGYGEKGPIGLNPEEWYCVFPGKPYGLPVHITRLPPSAWLRSIYLTDRYCLVAIEGQQGGRVAWRIKKRGMALMTAGGRNARADGEQEVNLPASLLFAAGEPDKVAMGETLPIANWPVHIIHKGQILRPGALLGRRAFNLQGRTQDGCMVFPPMGGKGAETSLDGFIRIPNDRGAVLAVSMGRLGGVGDGVHFVIRVNGREVFRQFRDDKPVWVDATVPLADYAGQAVVLSLAVDAGVGGANLSNDQAVWGPTRIVIPTEPTK